MEGKKQRRWPRVVLVCLGVFLLYAGIDLLWPVHSDLRGFDPVTLAHLETGMWRSYYERKPVALFFELAEVLRVQFHFPPLRSFLGAFHAARAAFVFKDGKERADYEQALPSLSSYFSEIHRTGNIDFNVRRETAAELEWWIVHRQRDRYSEDSLGHACALAAAALYEVSPGSTLEHGRLRAAAMTVRDTCAAGGRVREQDWALIDSLLHDCYESLHHAIGSSPTSMNLSR